MQKDARARAYGILFHISPILARNSTGIAINTHNVGTHTYFFMGSKDI